MLCEHHWILSWMIHGYFHLKNVCRRDKTSWKYDIQSYETLKFKNWRKVHKFCILFTCSKRQKIWIVIVTLIPTVSEGYNHLQVMPTWTRKWKATLLISHPRTRLTCAPAYTSIHGYTLSRRRQLCTKLTEKSVSVCPIVQQSSQSALRHNAVPTRSRAFKRPKHKHWSGATIARRSAGRANTWTRL